MSDTLIMIACAIAAAVVVWFVRGLVDGIAAGVVDLLPIG